MHTINDMSDFFRYDLLALNKPKFHHNRSYIDHCMRQGTYVGTVLNLINTSGLCVQDQALLITYCIEKGISKSTLQKAFDLLRGTPSSNDDGICAG